MAKFAAFLRAVNVGGTGKLPMVELRAICESLGFSEVHTYLASGNVVFETTTTKASAAAALAKKLEVHMGKACALFTRSREELDAIITSNPFMQAEGNRLMVILLDKPPTANMITSPKNKMDEEMALGPHCLFVHYPSGMGQSKLKIPGSEQGTARNMNTIQAVLEMMHA